MKKHGYMFVGLAVFLFASCAKEDETPRVNAPPATTPDTPPPTNTTTTAPPAGSLNLSIYTDDLQQGGAFLYPGGENQDLAFNDTSNPAVGANSLRYVWNGGDVSSSFGPEHIFCGVDLIHAGQLSDYNSTPGKNLQSGGYTHVTFYARGGLGTDTVLKIEVADDGNQFTTAVPCLVLSTDGLQDDSTPGNPAASCTNKATLTGTWQTYSIPVTPTDLAAVKDYFKATYIYKGGPAGTGGTVFFDQIVYQP